ncbi:hypothetical protein E9993_19935 [Labilibacter sediminis]|nr:hypothetical protein E9993_19935 [Labilibacter sediminis]
MEKFYTEKQIYASTFFGGPIPPGILIYKNFKRIGDDRKASLTLLLTFLFTVVLFYGLMQLPEEISDQLPDILFTSLYTGIVYLIYHRYLADKINDKIVESENKMSNWNVTGLTIIGLMINLVIILVFAFSEPVFPGEKIEYGELKHEIFYDTGDISNKDISAIGQILTDFEYFNNEVQQAVRVEKIDNMYLLNLPFQKDSWGDSGLLLELDNLKYTLNTRIGKKFKLILIHYDLSGKTLKKEI